MKFNNRLDLTCVLTVLVLEAMMLTSCASGLTKKDCQEMNYYDMGFNDGDVPYI